MAMSTFELQRWPFNVRLRPIANHATLNRRKMYFIRVNLVNLFVAKERETGTFSFSLYYYYHSLICCAHCLPMVTTIYLIAAKMMVQFVGDPASSLHLWLA